MQEVNISNNNLVTLKPLSSLKYLLKLNAKGNKLGKLLDFTYFIVFGRKMFRIFFKL